MLIRFSKKWLQYISMVMTVIMAVLEVPVVSYAYTGENEIVVSLQDIVKELSRSRGEGYNPDSVTGLNDDIREQIDGVVAAKGFQNGIYYIVVTTSMEELDDEVYENQDAFQILNNIVSMNVIVINNRNKNASYTLSLKTDGLCEDIRLGDVSVIYREEDAAATLSTFKMGSPSSSEALKDASPSNSDTLDNVEFTVTPKTLSSSLWLNTGTVSNAPSNAFSLDNNGSGLPIGARSAQCIEISLFGIAQAGTQNTYYAGYSKSKLFEFYIWDDGEKVAYCHNHDTAAPPAKKGEPDLNLSGFPSYGQIPDDIRRHYPLYQRFDYSEMDEGDLDAPDVNGVNPEQVASILYAGYPFDAFGLQKRYQVPDGDARRITQWILWSFTDDSERNYYRLYPGETGDYKYPEYSLALKEAGNNILDYKTGTLYFEDDKQQPVVPEFKLQGDNAMYKTDFINVRSAFGGEFSFLFIPSGIELYTESGDLIETGDTLNPGTRFQMASRTFIDNSQEIALKINYEYKAPFTYYYKHDGKTIYITNKDDINQEVPQTATQNLVRIGLSDEMNEVFLRVTFTGDGPAVDTEEPDDSTDSTDPTAKPTTSAPTDETSPTETAPDQNVITPSSPAENSGGGSDTPRPASPPTDNSVIILDNNVPLAYIPPVHMDPVTESLLLIDDGEVPLAALPKTGDHSRVNESALMFSGLLGGLMLLLERRRMRP